MSFNNLSHLIIILIILLCIREINIFLVSFILHSSFLALVFFAAEFSACM